MPDTRRIAGPEDTISPFSFQVTDATEALVDGKRVDGRKEHEHRPVFLKTGLITQAKGSAFGEFGQTKVVCAIYGPREVARREDFSIQGRINCELKFAPFSCRVRRKHMEDREDKDLSAQLLEALKPVVRLDTFPKSQVDIYVSVLENDGGVLSSAITCACLALADAGIELYDLVVGSTVRITGQTMLVDPCAKEANLKTPAGQDQEQGGELTIGFMPSLRQVSSICFHGYIDDLQVLTQAREMCQGVCEKLYQVLQETLIKSVQNRLKTK